MLDYCSNNYTFSILCDSWRTLWSGVAGFVPKFVGALIVFLALWLLAVLVGKLVWHLVKFLQIDRGLESVGFKKLWEKSGYKLDSAMFFYELVKWGIMLWALMAATNILGLTEVTIFLSTVVAFLPNVFVAAIVLIIGVLMARFLEGLVGASLKAGSLSSANTLAALTRWVVLIFTFLIALEQLQIGNSTLQIAMWGVIGGAALAFGLAFGLGGKDHADDVISKWRARIKE